MKPTSVIAVSMSKSLSWFSILFGVYMLNHGYKVPGGGFAGGALIVVCLPLMLASWGEKRFDSWLREGVYGLIELIGLLFFLIMAFKDFSYTFLYNASTYKGSEAAIVTGQEIFPWMSIAVGLIATGAFSLILIYMYGSIRMMDSGVGLGGERGHDRYYR